MDSNIIKNSVSGVLVIDKPVGLTSHDVVQIVRRGTGIRRVGHTGTLDPRASGVLVILLGPAVRLSQHVSASDKRYQATIRLGSSTSTYDSEGPVTSSTANIDATEEQFIDLLENYKGEIEQTPPPYSAVRVRGKRAYDRARAGETFQLDPRKINVYSLDLLEWAPPEVVIDVYCSSGTYVRSLAHSLGEDLGIGAHLVGLRRTKSGQFTLRDAVSLRRLRDAFEVGDWAQYLIPAAEALSDWPILELDGEKVVLVRNGHKLPVSEVGDFEVNWVRAVSEQGDLVALMERIEHREQEYWQPRKVFFTTQ